MDADAPEQLTDTDREHLRRAVELAQAALEAGDEPFGSVLVDATGAVRFEDHNHVASGDAADRAATTLYTSGEHCAMCAAAHAWAGLGRIVYATSAAQLASWYAEWGLPDGPVAPLPIRQVAPGLEVIGPVEEFVAPVRELQRRRLQAPPTERDGAR